MTFSDYFLGKTIVEIDEGGDYYIMHFSDGTAVKSYYSQDCCESVQIDHVDGDKANLIGSPILEAEECEDSDPVPDRNHQPESHTWTHHRFRTEKGEVTFVWLGESNGYYGETPYTMITHGRRV